MQKRKKIAFVCVGNSCRSQMAEGFAKTLGGDVLDVYSAGTHPSSGVNETAIAVMKEKGIDISAHKPKLLDDIPSVMNILISMGCGVVCPFLPNQHQEDWGLEDPVGQPIEVFRQTRDIIEVKVKELIEKVRAGKL